MRNIDIRENVQKTVALEYVGVDARREVRNRSLSGSIRVEVVLTLDIHHELPAPLWFLSSEAIEQISLARITANAIINWS